jgi:dynein heavy chain
VQKFLAEDIPLFNGIISDLFPGVEEVASDYSLLLEAIRASMLEMNLQPLDSFCTKCIQLYETTIVCVIISMHINYALNN